MPKDFCDAFWDCFQGEFGLDLQDIMNLPEQLPKHEVKSASNISSTSHRPADGFLLWMTADTVVAVREWLVTYMQNLHELKKLKAQRDQRKFQVKEFLEDAKYQAMRRREVEARVTVSKIRKKVEVLNLQHKGITHIASSASEWESLRELNLCGNNFLCPSAIAALPPQLEILSLGYNNFASLSETFSVCSLKHLVFLSVTANKLESLDFLLFLPSLVQLEASYNCLVDVDAVCATVSSHPALKDLTLIGNPLSFVQHYRFIVSFKCPNLQSLDEIKTQQMFDSRSGPSAEMKHVSIMTKAPSINARIQVLALDNLDAAKSICSADEIATIDGIPEVPAAPVSTDKKAKLNPKNEADKKIKGRSKIVAEETLKPCRRLSLSGTWCDSPFILPDVDLTSKEDRTPLSPQLKEKKGGKRAPAETQPVEVAAAPPLIPSLESSLAIDAQFGRRMMRPLVLHLCSHPASLSQISADGTSSIPTAPSEDATASVVVGSFVIDTSVLLEHAGVGTDSTLSGRVPLIVNQLSVLQFRQMKADLVALLDCLRGELTSLERLKLATVSPVPPVTPTVADNKVVKKGKRSETALSKRGAAEGSNSCEDELTQSIGLKKKEIEETQQKIIRVRRDIDRLHNCQNIEIKFTLQLSHDLPASVAADPSLRPMQIPS